MAEAAEREAEIVAAARAALAAAVRSVLWAEEGEVVVAVVDAAAVAVAGPSAAEFACSDRSWTCVGRGAVVVAAQGR